MQEKILVVDDEKDICRLLKTELELEGYEVTLASNGSMAMSNIQTNDFDLIFLDVRIPEMNGMEILRQIRGLKPEQKIIMMTAYDDPVYQEEAEKLGVAGYLFKPFPPQVLIKLCKEVLGKK